LETLDRVAALNYFLCDPRRCRGPSPTSRSTKTTAGT
jgi:hypothetical protein